MKIIEISQKIWVFRYRDSKEPIQTKDCKYFYFQVTSLRNHWWQKILRASRELKRFSQKISKSYRHWTSQVEDGRPRRSSKCPRKMSSPFPWELLSFPRLLFVKNICLFGFARSQLRHVGSFSCRIWGQIPHLWLGRVLRCCAGFSLVVVRGLHAVASHADRGLEHRPGSRGALAFVAPRHMGSSRIRDHTRISCVGRRVLCLWAPRGDLIPLLSHPVRFARMHCLILSPVYCLEFLQIEPIWVSTFHTGVFLKRLGMFSGLFGWLD